MLRPDFTGQVSQGAAQVVVPDIEPEHKPRVRPDLVEPGRTPGHAGHARLLAAGADPQLHVAPGGMHGFDLLPFRLEIVHEARARICAFLAGQTP